MSNDGGAADAIFGAGGAGDAGAGAAAGSGDGGAAASGGDAGGADDGGRGGAGTGDGQAAGQAQAGSGDPWYAPFGLSDVAEGDRPSDLQWLTNKGYKDPATLVKSMRQLESRVGGALVMPKEGEPAERFDAFYKAIGRPDSADGYDLKLPEGASLDETLFGSFKEAAFAAGVPKGMADQLGSWFVQQQLDADAAVVAARNQETTETLKTWGATKDANLALCNRAAAKLGMTRDDIANIQMGYGAGKTLELLQKLGAGMAEDVMIDGGGRQRFGVTAAEAQTELDKMDGDKATRDKILAGDQALMARRERLMAAIAAAKEEAQRAA